MDINDLRTIATVLVAIVFAGVVWWAFAPGHKKYFDDAAQLPFKDETSGNNGNSANNDSGNANSDSSTAKNDSETSSKGDPLS